MTTDRADRKTRQGNDEARLAAAQADKVAQAERISDIQFLLGRPEFRRFIGSVLEDGGIMRSVMTGNSQTFYNSGQQDFTRKIWASLASVNNKVALELLLPKQEND